MKLILDLDTGIDDAMALAYAVGHPEAEVLAVTSVFGNVETVTGADNAAAILKLLGREDIPVYVGAKRALDADQDYVQEAASGIFHGRNGLANLDFPAGAPVQDQDAVDYLVDQARALGDELTIVTTGPLTNLALAIQKDPEAMLSVRQVVSMGGALTVPGNVSYFAEANFNKDSKANNIVFDSGINMTMIGLDVTLQTLLTEDHINKWQAGSPAAQAFFDIVSYYFQAYDSSYDELRGCALHDPLAVSVALDERWVTGQTFCLRSLSGDQEGRIVQNLPALADGAEPNVRVGLAVDGPLYTRHFVETIEKAF
ncbi:ribosylpyrimidine nucleosidase [Aerococcus urinaehominis]|uniref:Ribosylpyrimidine nucleosidase n=1 Tax=Aerococcus urinaehominis TaxID=128944 RepID=A0A120IAN9_9LACT|nr:nucleoside hydrolase [Aerococcus urinaehominis]AMB98666.1 ribosylpyrimidine nucleosidase [Aerococcus urinaehominis]SDL97824.1 purine nucleosidase [Aerococcus urinaehominis]